jgi:prophage regulatory protein
MKKAKVVEFQPKPIQTATARINLPQQLENDSLLRLPQVLAVFPVGKTSFYAGIKDGRFPAPIKLGSRISAWRSSEIKALIDSMGGV